MRVIFMGSGAFGRPTAQAVAESHELVLTVSQPDRTAGRGRRLRATPISEWALENDLPLIRPEDVNEAETVRRIHAHGADAMVVIAFGQKIGKDLLTGLPAFNLHASLLPAYRGAAPINRAMMDGCDTSGVSVIGLAQRMDAGTVFASASIPIRPQETAGELHDRLAALGPEVVLDVLEHLRQGCLEGADQEEELATRAPKLSRAEATTDFDLPARLVRARIHGLTPWPGCDVLVDGRRLRIHRVSELAECPSDAPPGTLLDDGVVACGTGAVRLLEVQPSGKRVMAFAEWQRGHQVPSGARVGRVL